MPALVSVGKKVRVIKTKLSGETPANRWGRLYKLRIYVARIGKGFGAWRKF